MTATVTLCACGCGHPTRLAPKTYKRFGHVKGQPLRYIKGHAGRTFIDEHVEVDCGYVTPCWLYQGHKDRKGYGQRWDPKTKKRRRVHVMAYEAAVGPVPEGLELDHLCRQRACRRPDHLEPVTHRENIRRANEARSRRLA